MSSEITIITPSYNRAHTLERVYNSIIKQNFSSIKWLIMDDGSTDCTKSLVEKLKSKNEIEIEYIYSENRKKFCTLLSGILNYVRSPFFIIMDSDDEFYDNSIDKMYEEISQVNLDISIASVVGNTVNEHGELVGTEFPSSPLDCHIFEMRHKYRVRGGKMSIIDTSKFKSLDYNLEFYDGKGYVPDDVWQNIFDKHFKSRFVNQIFKIYHLDESDGFSLTNSRYTRKSAFGLKESYRTALLSYSDRWRNFPLVMLKKLFGYIYFGLHDNPSIKLLYADLNGTINKLMFVFVVVPVLIYKVLHPLSK